MQQYINMKSLVVFLVAALLSWKLFSDKPLKSDAVIDYIEVAKEKRIMSVYSNGVLLKTYKIALGFNPNGKKEFEGDGKVEGGRLGGRHQTVSSATLRSDGSMRSTVRNALVRVGVGCASPLRVGCASLL